MAVIPFGRWDSYDACVAENMLFHSEEDARLIADDIKTRVDSGTLIKKKSALQMKIMKGTDDDGNEEIVVYGPCSWAKRDPVGDFVTTEFMVDFFNKWFNQVPERCQNIMLNHDNYQLGWPLKSWVSPSGEKYFTHVHEIAPMLLATIRPDDGLKSTQKYRKSVEDGTFHSFSISWFPTRFETIKDNEELQSWWDTEYTQYHKEGEPIEVTICRDGMVDRAVFDVVKQYDTNTDGGSHTYGSITTEARSVLSRTPGITTAVKHIKSAVVVKHEVKVPLKLRLELASILEEAGFPKPEES